MLSFIVSFNPGFSFPFRLFVSCRSGLAIILGLAIVAVAVAVDIAVVGVGVDVVVDALITILTDDTFDGAGSREVLRTAVSLLRMSGLSIYTAFQSKGDRFVYRATLTNRNPRNPRVRPTERKNLDGKKRERAKDEEKRRNLKMHRFVWFFFLENRPQSRLRPRVAGHHVKDGMNSRARQLGCIPPLFFFYHSLHLRINS